MDKTNEAIVDMKDVFDNPISREETFAYIDILHEDSTNDHNTIKDLIKNQTETAVVVSNEIRIARDNICGKMDNLTCAINDLKDLFADIKTNMPEIAASMKSSSESIGNVISELGKNLVDASVSIVDGMASKKSTIKETKNISKYEPFFQNSRNHKEINEWIDERMKRVETINEYLGNPEDKNILFQIYRAIENEGIKLQDIYLEYKKRPELYYPANASKIRMCSGDLLRGVFDSYLKMLEMYYFHTNRKRSLSEILVTCPDSVKILINKYANKKGITYKGAQKRLYKAIEKKYEDYNLSLREEAKKYSKTIGYKNCCIGYYISKRSVFMELLEKLVEGSCDG